MWTYLVEAPLTWSTEARECKLKLSLTCIPGLVGCREPLSPDGPVAAEPHEHPVPVGGDGHVVRPPRAELRQARRRRVRAAVNLHKSIQNSAVWLCRFLKIRNQFILPAPK